MVSAFGRPAAGVDAVKLAGFGFPVDGEEVAADAVGHGLSHAEDGVGGDARVNGGAAASQDTGAGLRGLHVAGGHDAVRRDDHGVAVVAILGTRGDENASQSEKSDEGAADGWAHGAPGKLKWHSLSESREEKHTLLRGAIGFPLGN